MASGPQAPDAADLSNQQTKSNIKTATAQTGLNAINQRTPWGNQTFRQIGQWPDGTPRFESSTTLSQGQQGIFDQNQRNQQGIANAAGGATNRLNNTLGQSLNMPQYANFSGGPNMHQQIANAGGIQRDLGSNDFSGDRQRVEDALLGRVNQQSQQDLGSLQQRLANQGITQGTDAYSNAMRDYNQGLSENRTSAILGAGTEQNRMQQLALNAGNFANSAQAQQYGQNANDAQFGNQALQQQYQNQIGAQQLNNQNQSANFNNQLTGRNQSINELMALMGGSQMQQPQFGQTPQSGVANTDVTGNAWNQFNAQQGQSNQFNNGLGSLLGTIGGWAFSDRRLKEDVRDTGMETPGGVPVKTWRFKGSPMLQKGYIAQDVAKTQPENVRREPGGFLSVRYGGVR